MTSSHENQLGLFFDAGSRHGAINRCLSMMHYGDRQQVKHTLCPKFNGTQSHSESLGIRDQMQYLICDPTTCTQHRSVTVSHSITNFHTTI